MTKPVTLNGSEIKVSELEGQNVIVQNLGTSAIYASINPNIAPDADNVIEIPAGGGVNVYGANGTIYLMGTGRAQCTGTDYSTVNFKMPSSSASGGGGDTPAPSAETMPVMDGITAYFDTGTGSLTHLTEAVLSFNNVEEDGALFMKSRDGCARIYANDMPVIAYIVFKTLNDGTIIDRSLSPGYNYGMGLYVSNHAITCHSCNSDGVSSNVSAEEYHVVALVGYDMENGNTEQRLYIDGELAGINANNYSTGDYAKGRYGGYMAINGIARPGFQYDSNLNLYLKCFGMGSVAHTEEQIKQNSAWLMSKYGIGGG